MEHEKSHPEADFGLLIAQIPDYAFFMLDPTCHVSNWNRGAERLKGYCAQEIVGRHFRSSIPLRIWLPASRTRPGPVR